MTWRGRTAIAGAGDCLSAVHTAQWLGSEDGGAVRSSSRFAASVICEEH